MNEFLSKSDFKVARDCATKLFYKKQHFPTTLDDDAYMEMLADGGFMVGKFAQLLYPDGILISELDPTKAVAETASLMARQEVTLFEPAFFAESFLARVDVLQKEGDRLRLIEVKSKGYDPNEGVLGKRGGVLSEWREYVEDVAFQSMVLRLVMPKAKIECFLLLPDKKATSEIDLLPTFFEISRHGREAQVKFTGDAASIRSSRLLRVCPVDDAVAQIYQEVCDVATELRPFVAQGIRKALPVIGYRCGKCEYRVPNDRSPSGFRECWGKLADIKPSLLDLYQLGKVKAADKSLVADGLIAAGKVSLFDVPVGALNSAYADRQKVQIQHTRAGTEWRSSGLKPTLDALPYPLHFVDFETSRLVLPYHRGMRPFEQVTFEWSCHTIDNPGGPLRHSEWINVEEAFPNVKFAAELRSAIGDKGTLLTWSPFEKSALNDIARQIGDYHLPDDGIRAWLLDTANSGRIFDLCAHAQEHYFHPGMAGSNSIKAVLPAVWRANAGLRAHPWFKQYSRVTNGTVCDPYETLPKIEVYDRAEVVTEGTGAMRAYQEMVYGAGRHSPDIKRAWREILLQYCCLDTLAMVIIWKHWTA